MSEKILRRSLFSTSSRNNTKLIIHTLLQSSCKSFKCDQFPNKCQVLITPIAWGQKKITLIHDSLKNSGVYSDKLNTMGPSHFLVTVISLHGWKRSAQMDQTRICIIILSSYMMFLRSTFKAQRRPCHHSHFTYGTPSTWERNPLIALIEALTTI